MEQSKENSLAGTTSREIYPMPSFVRLSARDLSESRAWYLHIGFIEIYAMNGPAGTPIMSHLRWAKYADLMLVQATFSVTSPGDTFTLYFTVERGRVDEIAKLAKESVLEGPVLQPWNAREVVLRDPNGLLIAFSEQGDTSRSFEDVMSSVREKLS